MLINKFFIFFKGLFLDDTNEPCIGRFSLFLGMIISTFTIVFGITTEGEMSWPECAARATPAIVGLIAYIFTRLYESKEWVADLTKNLTKSK